jgi:membrane associated rhomboid family serine protease
LSEFSYRLKRFLYQEYIPITKSIAIITGALFLISYIPGLEVISGFLTLHTGFGFIMPWTLITYPVVIYRDIFTAVFSILWLWMIGGSLERSWGSRTYGLFFLLTTLVTGVIMSLVNLLQLTGPGNITGLWLPLLGVTWAWAKNAPDQELLFWGIIPMKAKLLAWLDAGITFIIYFQTVQNPLGGSFFGGFLFGLASLSGIAVVYLFSGNGPFSRGYRNWAWKRKFPPGGLRDKPGKQSGRKRFKVIK